MHRVSEFRRPNLFALVLFFIALALMAKAISKPKGPHGGVLQKADGYFIEMKNPGRKFYAFLLNKKLESISNKDISGEVRFSFPDSTSYDIALRPTEDEKDAFICEVPSDFNSCRITFKVLAKNVSAKFNNPVQLVISDK